VFVTARGDWREVFVIFRELGTKVSTGSCNGRPTDVPQYRLVLSVPKYSVS
jgi:hypothetical protein